MTAAPIVSANWQIETITAFVIKQKRERYIDQLASSKKRKQFVSGLAHFADFDPRYMVQITPSSQNAADIESLLRKRGAPETCNLISEISTIDNTNMPLADALRQIIGSQMGTIICCVPGHLAYFENEDGRFILNRNTSPIE